MAFLSFLCCICSCQVAVCTLWSRNQSLGSGSKGKGHRELDPPLLASLQGFTFMGFYGMGLVCKGGCLSSTYEIKKVVSKP